MKRLLQVLLGIMLFAQAKAADEFKIRLYSAYNIQQVRLSVEEGRYELFGNGDKLAELTGQQTLVFTKSGEKVACSLGEQAVGSFFKVELRRSDWEDRMGIQPLKPAYRKRIYAGNLVVEAVEKTLKIINKVELEQYLGAVILSEVGKNRPMEYLKTQAVISRTYALKNYRKHLNEGFNLKDDVSSQAYFGEKGDMSRIARAVKETTGMVVVDDSLRLITTAFYSNSGGQTVNSEDVWLKALPYLRSKVDTFSIGQPNYTWTKKIDAGKWKSYFKRKYVTQLQDSLLDTVLFHQPLERCRYYGDPSYGIPLKNVRIDWKLKSTHFQVYQGDGNTVLLRGKGFGHGVGLSQEGARKMADAGFLYADILHYYYTDVHIIDKSLLDLAPVNDELE